MPREDAPLGCTPVGGVTPILPRRKDVDRGITHAVAKRVEIIKPDQALAVNAGKRMVGGDPQENFVILEAREGFVIAQKVPRDAARVEHIAVQWQEISGQKAALALAADAEVVTDIAKIALSGIMVEIGTVDVGVAERRVAAAAPPGRRSP